MKPIIIGDKYLCRILRPVEFEQLLTGIKKEDFKLNIKIALLTGMRYTELKKFQQNPGGWDGNFIHIRERKKKRVHRERWVRVNHLAANLIPLFFRSRKLPAQQVWDENLKRWAERARLDPAGMCSKTTRKTWESWLVTCFPHKMPHIVMSQGHTETTALQHYIRLPFTKKDEGEMLKWVQGWDEI